MNSIIDPKLLERLRVGPLGPHLDLYLARIEQEGFLPSSVPCHLYAIARFSRWLHQGHVQLESVDEIMIRKFLDRDPGIVHHAEQSTLRRLVLILREIDVLQAEPQRALNSVQECVNEYREYLVQQRGLSQTSLPYYLSFVEQFLSSRFAGGEICFMELCASDVTTFLRINVARLSRGRAKLLVTALRTFLRYLLHQGKVAVDFAPCVLPVACWSYSEIPKS